MYRLETQESGMMKLGERTIDLVLDISNLVKQFPEDMVVLWAYGKIEETGDGDDLLIGGMDLKSPDTETLIALTSMMTHEYPPLLGAYLATVFEQARDNEELRPKIIKLLQNILEELL